MKLSYFPQLKVVHTSKIFHGQLYIPLANWSLMIETVLIASIYHNTTRLGNAYGVCVMFVTSFDTVMTSLVFISCYRFNPWLVAFPWLVFACLDGTFLSSALTKVPADAWFTLTLATILGGLFLVWRYGKEQQWFAEAEDRFPTSHIVRKNSEHELTLTERFGSTPISHVRGCGIFFDKAGETTPIVFSNFITKLTVAPEVMIFFHLRPLEIPSVPSDERHTVSRLAIPNCYRLVVRYGYNDEVITPNLAAVVLEQLRLYLLKCRDTPIKDQGRKEVAMTNIDEEDEEVAWKRKLEDERLSEELTRLDRAFNHKALYIIGKEQMKIKHGTNVVRTTLLKTSLWIRDNTRNKMANLNVPKDGIIEVGFLKEI